MVEDCNIMPYCSNCGCELDAGTKFCPNCGNAVSGRRKRRSSQPKLTQFAYTEEQSTEDAVRRGVTNAKFNDEMSNVFGAEVGIIAVVIGFAMKSWWWGGGTFLVFFILSFIPTIATIMCYIFGIAWGVIGYFLGGWLFGNDAAWVIAIIAGLCGIGANLASRQYLEDIGT